MVGARTKVMRFDSRSDFDNVYLRDIPGGGVFVQTDEHYTLSENVLLYLCFPDIPEGIPLNGTVSWRRPPTKWRSSLQPGIGVQVNDADQAQLYFLVNFSKGRIGARRAVDRRISAEYRVDFASLGRWYSGKTLNISREGLFILTDAKVSPDTALEMKLFLNGKKPPEPYFGRVAWQNGPTRKAGVGVHFQFKTPIRRKRIHHFVNEKEEEIIKKIPNMARTTIPFGYVT